jgi:hypothetical protein
MRRAILAVALAVGLVFGIQPALSAQPVGADGGLAGGHDTRQRLAVPAYWTPDAAGVARFDALVDAAPRVGMVVVNGPNSSAPTPFDPTVAAQIHRLYRAGITVLGYVDTGYLGRSSGPRAP